MSNLYETIDSHIRRLKNTIFTTLPAVVTEVITEEDEIVFISAKPVNDKSYPVSGEYIERKSIRNIPLLFPSSEQGIVSFPVKEGDHVVLLFCQEDIQNLIFNNQTSGKPNTKRRLSADDAIAIPAIHSIVSTVRPHKDNFRIMFKGFSLEVNPNNEVRIVTDKMISIEAEESVNVTTEATDIRSSKVRIGSERVDIVGYLTDLTQAISDITVDGKPVSNKADFEALKIEIDSLKG